MLKEFAVCSFISNKNKNLF